MSVHHRLLGGLYAACIGIVAGVIYHHYAAVGKSDAVYNAGRGGYKVKVIFPFQTFLDYLHVKEPKEPAAEPEPEGGGGFGFEGKGRVVETQLFQSVPKITVTGAVSRVYAGENLESYAMVVLQNAGYAAIHRAGYHAGDFSAL